MEGRKEEGVEHTKDAACRMDRQDGLLARSACNGTLTQHGSTSPQIFSSLLVTSPPSDSYAAPWPSSPNNLP